MDGDDGIYGGLLGGSPYSGGGMYNSWVKGTDPNRMKTFNLRVGVSVLLLVITMILLYCIFADVEQSTKVTWAVIFVLTWIADFLIDSPFVEGLLA